MARPLKWILGIVGGLIIISITAVVIILSTYDFNDLKPRIAKAVYDATGRELVIDSDIDLNIGFSPSLVLSEISFQNAGWGSEKEMLKVGRFEVKVALLPLIRGNIEINRFILKDFDILIETDKEGKANFEFETADVPTTESKPEDTAESEDAASELPALTIDELQILNGTLTYRDGKTGKTEKVAIDNLTAAVKGFDNPFTFDLKGRYNDDPFEVTGTLGSIKAVNDPSIIWPIDITAKAFGVNSSIKGSIKNPVEQQGIKLDFSVKIDEWSKLSGLAGQEIPVKDALSVSGNVADLAPNNYQISALKIALGKNIIEGAIGANLAGKVPFIDVSLSSKELDLKTLMPSEEKTPSEKSEKTEAPSSKESDRLFPDDSLPLESLKAVDGKFRIRFDKVITPQIVINNFAMDSTIKNGNFTLKPLKAELGGGSINLEASLLSKGNAAALTTVLSIKDIEIADILKDSGSKEILEGSIDADIDIKGQGKSVASIMAGLNGYSRIIMGEGKIDNKIIDKLGGDMSKNVFRLLNPSIDKKKYTTLKCMVTRFDMRDGIADATAFVFNTSVMSVIGEGSVNLKNETLNLSLAPSTKGGVAGYNLNIGELSQPFKLGGTLAKPSLKLDKEKTVASIGKLIGKKLLKDKSATQETAAEGSSEEDICAAALKAAETGVKMTSKKEADGKEEPAEVTPEKLIKDVVKDPENALKSLFGR